MELLARADELTASGHDVIHLEVGEPDFDTPSPILAAAQQVLLTNAIRYTDARGILPLREAISGFYRDRFKVDVSPDRLFVTSGASGGLLLVTALLMNPGEKLLMADPGYPCNRHFLTAFGAEALLVPVSAEDNFQLSPALVSRYWDDKTRGALVASPANPTGSVLSREELAALASEIASRSGILVVDEIYQGLVYEEELANTTVLSVAPDVIVVNSFSKYFGMTGWRLGWLVVPDHLTRDLEKLAQNLFICPSAVAQHAALAAFGDEALGIMENHRKEFAKRRDYLTPALRELGFDIAQTPAGAFYVYARLPAGATNSGEFCRRLLEEEYVAIAPGADFGFHEAERHVRISYARDQSQLREAVKRIGRILP